MNERYTLYVEKERARERGSRIGIHRERYDIKIKTTRETIKCMPVLFRTKRTLCKD